MPKSAPHYSATQTKTSIRMGLVKFTDQIRTKIVEEVKSNHFWSIVFQCPIQDPSITLTPGQDSDIPGIPAT